MADDTDETGKKNARPGEAPAAKRPFATIDLKATEVAAQGGSASVSEPKPGASGPADKSEPRPETKPSASGVKAADPASQGEAGRARGATWSGAGFMSSLTGQARSSPFLTHSAAGATGALIVLAVTYALAPDPAPGPARAPEVGELTRRVAELEGVLGTRPGAGGLRARVEEMSRNVAALGNAQAKLSREAKEWEERIGSGKDAPSELAGRIAKLEQGMAAAPGPADQTSGQPQQSAALSARMAELEKAAQESTDAAKSAAARMAAELAAIRTEAGRLGQRMDGIKGEVEERMQGAAKAADFGPIARRIAALERDLQGYVKNEAGRRADAGRIVLALELAALRRAVDRGDSYTTELAAVKSAAGDTLNLAPIERHMREGVSPVRELEKSFHRRRQRHARRGGGPERCDAGRPAHVQRALDRARAQGRSHGRGCQRGGRHRPHGSRAQGRAPGRSDRAGQEAAAEGVAGGGGLGQARRGAPLGRPGHGRRRVDAEGLAGARPLRRPGATAMIRLVIFLLGVLAAAIGLDWLASRPGTVVVEWQGYVVETSVLRALSIVALLMGAALLAWSTLRWMWASPALLGRLLHRRREKRGLEALSSGIIAIGAGDRALAIRYAGQARKALPNEPLTHLLRAQAAHLTGDRATARRIFEAMLASPDTELLGLRGLFMEAQRESDAEACRQFAERALRLNPRLEWPVEALFDIQCRTEDWQGALDTLAIGRRNKLIDKTVADRRRAVLLTAQAQAAEDTAAEKALGLALEAHRLAPDLVPAAAIAGRVLASKGNTPRAARVLLKTWRIAPHPDLAAAYAYARPGDSPRDRLNRVRHLARLTPQDNEGPDRARHHGDRGARMGRGAQGAGTLAGEPAHAAHLHADGAHRG